MKAKFISLAAVLLMACGGLTSCEDDKEIPSFIKSGQTDVELDYTGLAIDGYPVTIEITTNDSWSVSGKSDWIILDRTQGSRGCTQVKISAEVNDTGTDRTGFVEYETSGGKFSIITVAQSRVIERLEVAPTSVSMNFLGLQSGATPSIKITSNTAWTVTVPESASWLTLSQTSGQPGTASVTLAADLNDTGKTRTASLTVSAGEIKRTVSVTQASDGLTLDKSSVDFKANPTADVTVTLKAQESWTSTYSADWLTLSQTSGEDGIFQLTLRAAPNAAPNSRSCTIEFVSAHGVKATLAVSQEAHGEAETYYKEMFDWTENSIFVNNGSPIGDAVGSNGVDWNRLPVNNSLVAPYWAASGLKKYGTLADNRYNIQWGSMMFNDNAKAAMGVILPEIPLPDYPVNVTVSFKAANDGNANSGAGDTVNMQVEVVAGDGWAANGTPISDPAPVVRTMLNGRNWHPISIELTGVKKGSRIAIHSVSGAAANQRYYLDEIVVKEKL